MRYEVLRTYDSIVKSPQWVARTMIVQTTALTCHQAAAQVKPQLAREDLSDGGENCHRVLQVSPREAASVLEDSVTDGRCDQIASARTVCAGPP